MKYLRIVLILSVILTSEKIYVNAQVLQESNAKATSEPAQPQLTKPAPELNNNFQELLNNSRSSFAKEYSINQSIEALNYQRKKDSTNRQSNAYLIGIKNRANNLKIFTSKNKNNPKLKRQIDSLIAQIRKDSTIIVQQIKDKKKLDSITVLRENEKVITILLNEYVTKDSLYRKIIADDSKVLKEVNSSILVDTVLTNSTEQAEPIKKIYKRNVSFFQVTNSLLKDIDKIVLLINKYEKKIDSTKALSKKFDQIILAAPIEIDLLKQSDKIENDIRDFTLKYNTFKKDYDSFAKEKLDLINGQPADDLAVVPTLVSQLGQGSVTPNITLLGNTNFGTSSNGLYGDIRVFTSPASSNQAASFRNFFIPEASSYGFLSNFGYSFQPVKKGREDNRFGLFLALNYLGKIIPDIVNSKSISENIFHSKFGFQAILIPGAVSAYLSGNYLLVTDNSSDFSNNYPSQSGRGRFFSDFGFKFFISPAKNSQLNLLIDLGFVRINDDMRDIFKNTNFATTTDSVIPVLKIGIKKNFGF